MYLCGFKVYDLNNMTTRHLNKRKFCKQKLRININIKHTYRIYCNFNSFRNDNFQMKNCDIICLILLKTRSRVHIRTASLKQF